MDTEFCAQFYWAPRKMLYDIFWAVKLAAIGKNWMGYSHILSVWSELNNSDLLARAINLNPQKLSYLTSQLVVVVVFVCFLVDCAICVCVCVWLFDLVLMYLCDCVSVCLCLFEILDASKNMTKEQPSPSCHHHQPEAFFFYLISKLLVVPTAAGTTG